MSLEYLKKWFRGEVDFLHADKLSFYKFGIIVFDRSDQIIH